jgi:hypothetical protein
MSLKQGYLGDVFQQCFQCFQSAARFSCQRADPAEMLVGRGLRHRYVGRSSGLLELPCAVAFASLSARSLGPKHMCAGVQWSWVSTMPLVQPFHFVPCL